MGRIVEAFSISHAQVLDGSTAFEDAIAGSVSDDEDIYGVSEGSLTPDTGQYENTGDDAVLSRWTWFNFADVAIQSGYLSFPLIASLTGGTISSSGAGNSKWEFMDLWHEDAMNIEPKPMLLTMPSKDETGKVLNLTIGLYRVQFAPIQFDGPRYKDGLKVNYNGTALMSNFDEEGNSFSDGKKRVGKLISHPA